MKNNPFTRFLSVALTAVMLVGVMPGAVLADAGEAIVGASSAVVESIPESTTPADAAPVATEVPPVTEPEATPETVVEPEASPEVEATPEAAEQPETTPEATQEPEATPEATEQPETTPEATQEPEATPEATEEPEATPEATEEPETSPEPTEEPVELNEEAYTVTVDVTGAQGVTVTVKVPANTLPEGVNLVAEMLAEDTQAHADAEAALADEDVEYDGMVAMDIRFEDADGNEVEPANEVEVSIDAQALLPEDADPETVAVQHLKEDATGAVAVETVANVEATTGDVTVVENADQPALNMASTFAVDGFSTFTITWITKDSLFGEEDETYSVVFDIVDTEGNPLEPTGETLQINVGTDNTKRSFAEALAGIGMDSFSIAGEEYVFQSAVYIDGSGVAHSVSHYARVESDKPGAGAFDNPKHVLRLYDSVFNHDTTGFYSLEGDADVRLIYRKAADGDAGEVETETELQRVKQVWDNGDGTYNLELSVAGEVGSITDPVKMDVAFVIDISNSMKDSMGNTSRIAAVGDAVRQIVTQFSQNDKIDVRYSMVHFSSGISSGTEYYNDAYQTRYWTKDSQSIINSATRELTTSGGTNYQAGIMQVRSLMLDARPDAQKYVIFLSDGAPTYHYNEKGETKGTGGSTSADDKQYAYNEARLLTNLNGFYSIRVGDERGADDILQTVCGNAYQGSSGANPDNFKNYAAENVEQLLDVFAQIEGNITHLLCDNVTVTDTLSEYVQPVSGAQPLLTVTDAKGKPASVSEDKVWAFYDNGELKINFASDYKLEAGYTYKVTMQIEPTQKAYDDYALTGYPATGDANTGDYAGLPGFRSNKEASVTYTYNGTVQSNKYPHPVVQIEPQTLTIEKTVVGLEGADLKTLEDQLTFAVTLGDQTTNYTLSQFTDLGGGKYQLTISNLMPGTEYSVREDAEKAKVPLYDLTMMPADGVRSGTIARGTNKASFTNTYEPSVGDLTITKKLDGLNGNDKSATFLFEITGGGKTYYAGITMTAGECGLNGEGKSVTIKNLPAGDYTVTEILCPSGYVFGTSDPSDGKVTVSGDGAYVTFTNSKSSDPDDPTKDDGVVINQFTYETEGEGRPGWFWNRFVS